MQFSLRAIMIVITSCGVFFALPRLFVQLPVSLSYTIFAIAMLSAPLGLFGAMWAVLIWVSVSATPDEPELKSNNRAAAFRLLLVSAALLIPFLSLLFHSTLAPY